MKLSKSTRKPKPIDPRTATEAECWDYLPIYTTLTKGGWKSWVAMALDGKWAAKGSTRLGALRRLVRMIEASKHGT